jgi:sialate O-acetylesterase
MKVPFSLLATLLLVPSLHAAVKLPLVFSDHMVLQRDAPVPVWGWADAGEEITVAFAGQTKKAKADAKGDWAVTLDPMPASGEPRELTAGNQKCADVLVGEVWLASGQSNMELAVKDTLNPEAVAAAADFPRLRLFKTRASIAFTPKADVAGGPWTVCSPQTAASFSAVAYFFARELQQRLGVPVGVVVSCWGNTQAHAWMSRETLAALPETRNGQAAWLDEVRAVPDGETKFEEHHREWARGSNNRPKDAPPVTQTFSKKVQAGAYNAMIAPLQRLRIRGVIWYQGESDAYKDPQAYRAIFPALVRSWRQAWGIGDFPFLYVQLANHLARLKEPGEGPWAELREAQTLALREPNTAMAVAVDLGGDGANIHPKNKEDVGRRLALGARAVAYGEKIEHSGPLYESMKIEGTAVRLRFTHAEGLAAKDNAPLTGFAIAGADKKFVWADAKVDGNCVVVSSAKVPAPVAVRYAWGDNPECNLINAAGLPASPFRTDEWPLPGVAKKTAE